MPEDGHDFGAEMWAMSKRKHSTKSESINLAVIVSRSLVIAAMFFVWAAGPKAPGVDRKTFYRVFGHGPGSRSFFIFPVP